VLWNKSLGPVIVAFGLSPPEAGPCRACRQQAGESGAPRAAVVGYPPATGLRGRLPRLHLNYNRAIVVEWVW